MAVYGFDLHGMPVRNLIRHKREYPSSFDANYSPQTGRPAGTDQASQATDDDYELRRARTPVPTFVAEAVEAHLARIYSREVHREGPSGCWPGGGTSTARAHRSTSGCPARSPRCCSSWASSTSSSTIPPVPEGEEIRSRADEVRLGLDTCVASYILPENLVWWTLDRLGGYDECLVREVQDDGQVRWRYWDARSLDALRPGGQARWPARSSTPSAGCRSSASSTAAGPAPATSACPGTSRSPSFSASITTATAS